MSTEKDEVLAQLDGQCDTPDDKVLHLVVKSQYPVALCGYVTRERWDPNRESAGWDRCPECLKLAHEQGRRM